jgi:hypothetical protein
LNPLTATLTAPRATFKTYKLEATKPKAVDGSLLLPEQLPLLMPKPGQEGYNPSEPQNMQSHKTYGVSRFCLFPVLWNTRQDQYTTVAYVAFLVTWLTVGYYFMQPCPNGAPFFSFCAGAGSDVYVCAVSPDGTSCLAQY